MKALLREWRQVARLVRGTPAARRGALARGDRSIRTVWPGALPDMASLAFWRGLYWPIVDRLPSTRRARNAATGCPLCDQSRGAS